MNKLDIEKLEENIFYKFKNHDFIFESLRHSSFVNEQSDSEMHDNERFEFLGDAVLNLVISHILMERFPEMKEGALSKMRAGLVNESQLAIIAQSINLGEFIQLGKGEIQSHGRGKKSILANTFEALIAAIYLDSGFDSVFKVIQQYFFEFISSIPISSSLYDYKSQLQELAQFIYKTAPQYLVYNETGPDHDKTFSVQLELCDIKTEGIGKSKKNAEQDAAKKALEILNNDKEINSNGKA